MTASSNIIIFERKVGFVLEHREQVQGDIIFHDYLVFWNGEIGMIRETFHNLKEKGKAISLGAYRVNSSKWKEMIVKPKRTKRKNGR